HYSSLNPSLLAVGHFSPSGTLPCIMQKVSVFLLTERFILSTCDQHQYHFVSGSFTWSEAQAYCRQKHTDLATIQSFTEVERVWIGLYSEMDWRWSDGFTGSGAEYRDWETSDDEPDFYYAYQFCVLIAKNGKYWDDSCSISYPFICYNGNEKQLLHSVLTKT
uniref:C-type lectin domain-containing protein n=1 Tax=Xiphophorus couchianus TaxID=32473 RepID=A0A3B5LQG7_9TELE